VLKFGIDWHLAAVGATFVIGQALEGTLLTPWLVGDRVGLHPVVVMVAVIVGGNVLGIVGIVIAVPVTAALAVVGFWLLERWKASGTFNRA
jgi:predicted PurR-regulated permease PerM